jgi:5-methylcytosine-specific restriction endonuclease McrA
VKKHTKIFFDYYDIIQGDFIPCYVCSEVAVDLHHIEQKGMGGSKQKDAIDNLIPLCRKCHEKAHANILKKEYLKELVKAKL